MIFREGDILEDAIGNIFDLLPQTQEGGEAVALISALFCAFKGQFYTEKEMIRALNQGLDDYMEIMKKLDDGTAPHEVLTSD